MTLDEWFYENELEAIRENIRCHCDVFCQNAVDSEELSRMILITIRDGLTKHFRFSCT